MGKKIEKQINHNEGICELARRYEDVISPRCKHNDEAYLKISIACAIRNFNPWTYLEEIHSTVRCVSFLMIKADAKSWRCS